MTRFRLALTMGAAVALLVGASSLAYSLGAASAPPKITACYAKATGKYAGVKHLKGEMRFIPNSGRCLAWETRISWNQRGIQGPVGPQGPQGEPGEDGTSEPGEVLTWTTTTQAMEIDGDAFVIGSNGNNLSPVIPAGKTVHIEDFSISGCTTRPDPGSYGQGLRLVTGAPNAGSGSSMGAKIAEFPFTEGEWPDRTTEVESHFEATVACSGNVPPTTVTVKYTLLAAS